MFPDSFPWPIHERRLDNGLRVVVSPDRTVPIVAVNIGYSVGSRNDPAGGRGFAHLVEHMMFEGSMHVGRGQHEAKLSAIGASGINATTSMDRTKYYQTVPSSHLDLALWLEADRMGSLQPSDEIMLNQVAVIRNEYQQRFANAPYGHWLEIALSSIFPQGHPYAHHSIGSSADLQNADLGTVEIFRRQYYVPQNAVLSVVGDILPNDVFAKAEAYFSGIPGGTPQQVTSTSSCTPAIAARNGRYEPDRLAREERVYIVHHIPAVHAPDHDALTVLATVLGRGQGSRFYRSLMADRSLAKKEERAAFAWELSLRSSIFTTGMTVQNGTAAEELLTAQEAIIDELATALVSDAELNRAKSFLAASWLRSITPLASRADVLGSYTAELRYPAAVQNRLARLARINKEDLLRVAEAYLRPESRFILILHPTSKESA